MTDLSPFNNVVFVQFSLTKNNKPNIPYNGIYNLKLVNNSLIPGETFIGLERGTRYGMTKLKGCTHWGLVDISNPESPRMIHHAPFLEDKNPTVVRMRSHYIIIRSTSQKHFKFYISKNKSYRDMRKKRSLAK